MASKKILANSWLRGLTAATDSAQPSTSTSAHKPIFRVVQLPRDGPDYLGASDFLALLAYPNPSDRAKRNRLSAACCDHVIRLYLEKGHLQRKDLVLKRKLMTNKEITQTIAAAWRRIRGRRIPAAELLITSLWFKVKNPVDRLRKQMLKVGIINRVEEQSDSANKNILSRVRAESGPVLHLAMALNAVIHQGPRRTIGFYTLLNNPTWVRGAIDSAERSREMFIAVSGDPESCSARLSYRLE